MQLSRVEEKIECFVVSILPVRAEAEVHNRRYWDILTTSLKDSIKSDAQKIEAFSMEGINILRQQPSTAEELSKASIQYSELLKSTPDMVKIFDDARKKNKVLASWTKEKVNTLDEMSSVWQSFQLVLGNRESVIEEQVRE